MELFSTADLEDSRSKPLVPSLTAVPDSCCLKVHQGCGKAAFSDDLGGSTIRESSLR